MKELSRPKSAGSPAQTSPSKPSSRLSKKRSPERPSTSQTHSASHLNSPPSNTSLSPLALGISPLNASSVSLSASSTKTDSHSSRRWFRHALDSFRRPRTSQSHPSLPKMEMSPETLQLRPRSRQRTKLEPQTSDSPVLVQTDDKAESMRDSAMMDSENQNNAEDQKRGNKVESLPTIVVHGEEDESAEGAPEEPQTAAQPQAQQERSEDSSEGHEEETQKNTTDDTLLDDSIDPASDAAPKKRKSFRPISTAIPAGGFDDISDSDNIQFSTRGSLMLLGRRANFGLGNMDGNSLAAHMKALRNIDGDNDVTDQHNEAQSEPTEALTDAPTEAPTEEEPKPTTVRRKSHLRVDYLAPNESLPRSGISSMRILSADEVFLSRKVRSMYEYGDENAGEWVAMGGDIEGLPTSGLIRQEPMSEIENGADVAQTASVNQKLDQQEPTTPDLRSGSSSQTGAYAKEPTEVAGGIEDWEDVQGGDVDRYGFIVARKSGSRGSGNSSHGAGSPRIQRVSTALQLASETPRRQKTLRRQNSVTRSMKSTKTAKSAKPAASLYSYRSTSSFMSGRQRLRYATNRLPHHRDRRRIDEAGDMLTLPPGLADIAEVKEGGRLALEMKKKEWEREDKWRSMGKARSQLSGKGGGMIFEFDTKDPKVISRTWKGIPDRWRAMAWWSFLDASARTAAANGRSGGETADELIDAFHRLQDQPSPDDMQIDVDVPRTIGSHIMFRKRYRGGQRLLFRVLHAFSLYLADTGYVQGMAALTATLVCYYDEERAFVMLVRLFKLRGLERLYQTGFDGLMEALGDFEQNWLDGNDVALKLNELGVASTSYGTRWYLTLFNYSLPFVAQLRVWDVFMLLGDVSNCIPAASDSSPSESSFAADLDVLHATSMALIDATREILLDSDFENAMKVLTSWVPVRDEEMLMKVVKVEWRARKLRGEKKAGASPGTAAKK